ncbi:hypothetical protein A2164_00150 [Candidatus Curtissbacteria bacterium RBG_13_35_7]|uniref:Sugar 3,4-ketoisomerase QdtA cupin domain-containing protein n=1 Tax=Candidatus Curtissbacteria bacterium RBG_13_35_7 TaxID=1797705 RepID=A0A1F5G5A5_9BACT|nr:MAG: hypothetical protein A2164_00150 [Candidatus Curtissbacteria bacterium RBG_13_35_7]
MPIQVVKTKPEFIDDRGFITRLIDQDKLKIRAVLYIKSKAGSIRGNHYHKTDYHYVYCLSGKFRYSEKDLRNTNPQLESVVLKPGDLVLSNPMVAHAMEFLEDSIFMAFTTEKREQRKYEQNTVRIKIVKNDEKCN